MTSNIIDLPRVGFVPIPVVATTLGVSRSTVYNWVESGLLPQPAKIGPRRVGFDVRDVRAIIDAIRDGTFADGSPTIPRLTLVGLAKHTDAVQFPDALAEEFRSLLEGTPRPADALAFIVRAQQFMLDAHGGSDAE